jgi:hypothetical protein
MRKIYDAVHNSWPTYSQPESMGSRPSALSHNFISKFETYMILYDMEQTPSVFVDVNSKEIVR